MILFGALFVVTVCARALFLADSEQGETVALLLVPSSGVAITCLAMQRKRHWVRLAAAAALIEILVLSLWAILDRPLGVAGALAIAAAGVATAFEAFVGARILREGRGKGGEIDGLRAFLAFSAAAFFGGLLGALLHVLVSGIWLQALSASGDVSLGSAFLELWRARTLGAFLVGPAVLAFGGLWRPVTSAERDDESRSRLWSSRSIEWIAWSLMTVVVALVVLARFDQPAVLPGSKEYLLLPPLFWAALRFDLRTSGSALLLLGFVLLPLTIRAAGPFGLPQYSITDGSLAAQTFLAVVGAATLLGGAAVADRRRGEDERHQLAARLDRAREMGAIGRLAQQVGGELQADLTLARAACERLLRERQGDPRVEDSVGAMTFSISRAEAAAARLFAVGVRSGRRPAPVSLTTTVEGLLEDLRRNLKPSSRLEFEAEEDLPPVRVELADIESLLADLVSNAEHALGEGGTIHLRIGRSHVDRRLVERLPHLSEGTYVAIEVEDDGVGMSEETLANAFDPGMTTRRAEGALGLGLASVRATAHALGGAVELRSTPGEGTRALVLLPPGGPASPSSDVKPRDPAHSPGTVLVVEDEKLTRDFVLRALESDGYEVLVAPEGEAALELAYNRPGRVDLLLVDIGLPGRDGLAVAREFLGLQPSARVLFMSGAFATAPASSLLSDASGFLSKPFTVGDLNRAVARVLRGRAGGL